MQGIQTLRDGLLLNSLSLMTELEVEVIEQISLRSNGLMWELPVDVIQSMETVVVCNLDRISLINLIPTLLLFDSLLKVILLNVSLIIRMC